MIASRLQGVVCELIGEHQTCGIKGRSIQTNVHVARSVLDFCTDKESQVAIIQIDLQKAFDRVDHEFLFDILSHVGVGKIILEAVKMSYTGCYTRLIINNATTRRIPVASSVRQGCPMSLSLFGLYLEPFCLKIIASKNCHGINMHSAEIKILAYADDIAVFCRDKRSVSEALCIARSFCEVTGASIRTNKLVLPLSTGKSVMVLGMVCGPQNQPNLKVLRGLRRLASILECPYVIIELVMHIGLK